MKENKKRNDSGMLFLLAWWEIAHGRVALAVWISHVNLRRMKKTRKG